MKKFEELIDVSLDEASRILQKSVNYGDYLAEQKKIAQLDVLSKKESMKEMVLMAKHNKEICNASDAKARSEQAEHYASKEVKAFETAEIEANYISDLFKNNHDRIEALRSVMSSKRQNLGDYQRNVVN